ncbi:DUF1236 domain-containing protein [Chelativorans sp. YIM 93263]|uniref:DUF1236 domain-containing protein n=1 Tax=Chelativorans sp. YIM 93263 TaxID=2906648 RepID=UPI002378F86F|nr:DUF1236 domain-containing protein [Chelativorans sp. YIM 93263]
MKRFILAGLVFLASASMAAAQEVVIQPEQETVIRDYVTTQQVAPSEVPADVTIEVGTTLPDTVELHPLEAPELDVQYRYVVVEDRTVLVDPDTREIVYIIE